jgi:predicted NBD/HSP70 family sugar kinase
MRTGRRELIRDLNRAVVLNLVRERRSISRAEIARVTGLSPSTVTAITGSLLADELLVEDGPATERGDRAGSVGRPATMLRVDPTARYVVGVKLAPESLTATVTDLDAEPLAMVSFPHGAAALLDEIIELFGRAIDDLRTEARLGDARPLGLGVGLPGGVDPVTGRVTRSPLPSWVGEDLRGTLERRFDVPVLIDNDVNTLTVAEHLYGSGQGIDDVLVVTIGRGIGMGAVIDGSVVRGARGALGEIGHLAAVSGGHMCWCGRRGCLEAEAAEPAVVRDVFEATGRRLAPDELPVAADADRRVAEIVHAAGRLVGAAVGNATTLFDPRRVIVSGEGVRLGRHYLDGIREGIPASLQPGAEPELVFEPWGDEAWARGAATLVLRELFTPAHLRGERHPARSESSPRVEPSAIAAS